MTLARAIASALDPVVLARQIGMDPWPWQLAALRSQAPRALWLAHRQAGKSRAAALLGLHSAIYQPGSTVLIVSVGQRQAQELLRHAMAAYRSLGRPIPAEAENALSLTLESGSRIIAVPGDQSTIRGYSADLLILDEAAQVPDGTYDAVLPMVTATRGRILALTSPWGRRGWFYEAWTDEMQQWERHRMSALNSPAVRLADLEALRYARGDYWLRQEYMVERRPDGTWADVPDPFADAVAAVFSSDLIRAAINPDIAPLFEVPHG